MESMAPGSTIILNEESAYIDLMKDAARAKKLSVVTFGVEKGNVKPESVELTQGSTELVYKGVRFSVPVFGIHNVSNIMAALACAEVLGVPLSDARDALRTFENVGKRNDIIERAFTLINDTYNANPLSLRYALRSLSSIYKGRRTIAVLSDMKELGVHAEQCHRDAGAEAVRDGISRLYTWGELARFISLGASDAGMAPADCLHFSSKDELIQRLAADVKAGDAILVKVRAQ